MWLLRTLDKHGKFDGMGTKWGEGKKREEKRINKELADRIAAAIPSSARPASPDIPEELESVWDPDVEAAFRALIPRHQDFVLAYIREGVGSAAYRKVYNPLAKDHTASVCAAGLLARPSIQAVLKPLTDRKVEAFFVIQKAYHDAAETATKPIFGKDEEGQPCLIMEQPDHAVRIKAAEALAKLHGYNAADKVEHSGEVISKIVQVELPKKDPIA